MLARAGTHTQSSDPATVRDSPRILRLPSLISVTSWTFRRTGARGHFVRLAK